MYVDFYKRISEPLRRTDHGAALLAALNKLLVLVTALTFVGVGVWLAVNQDIRIFRYLAVCAVSFIGASALRSALNRPRPYELYPIDGLISKDTKGKSFPSRHLFSASVIACALLWLNTVAGIIFFVITAVLGAVRIVGGVHFPRDIIAGISLGAICGILGFWVI